MELTITQEDYRNYLQEKDKITNIRIRPQNQDFFDAVLSVDMESTPEGKTILETIGDFG
jgi:hypothetical protein